MVHGQTEHYPTFNGTFLLRTSGFSTKGMSSSPYWYLCIRDINMVVPMKVLTREVPLQVAYLNIVSRS